MKCTDCKGSGVYIGIFKQETCSRCNGTKVEPTGKLDFPEPGTYSMEAVAEHHKVEYTKAELRGAQTPPGIYAAVAVASEARASAWGKPVVVTTFRLEETHAAVKHYNAGSPGGGRPLPFPLNGRMVYVEVGSRGGVLRAHQSRAQAEAFCRRRTRRIAPVRRATCPVGRTDENLAKMTRELKTLLGTWEDAGYVNRAKIRDLVADITLTY